MNIYDRNFLKLFKFNSYSLVKDDKNKFIKKELNFLNKHHLTCKEYKKITDFLNISNQTKIEFLPMLPIRLFKKYDLITTKDKIVKKIFSSGTSGSRSRINLDAQNAKFQSLVLKKIFEDNFGSDRFPMLIIDKKPSKKQIFDASIAGILGFSIFGRDHTYLLNEDNTINYEKIRNFIKKYEGQKKFIFGLTSKIYEYLVKSFDQKKLNLNLKSDFIVHGGGWKKLENKKISNDKFKKLLQSKFKINKIINYYGMVEQTGSIFFECELNNYFHVSNFSEIFIRDKNLSVINDSNSGIIQLISILPRSYPGHNILTEDVGIILGQDDCKCGKKGKYFKILGRVKNAESRGCGNES